LLTAGGLAIGTALGVFGGGGTLLALPLLIATGVAPKPAIAASLLVVAGTAAAAAAAHLRAGNVDWRATALFAPASMLAAYAAGWAAEHLTDDALVLLFAGVVVASGAAMLRRPAQPGAAAVAQPSAILLVVVGALGGALSGLVGAGGGTIYVPALALLAGLPIRRAVGTSVVVITLVATSALAGHLSHVELPLGIAATVGAPAVAGAWLGQRFSRRAPERSLRSAFALLLFAVAIWLVTRESHVAAWLSGVLGPARAGP
jgi:uncharacterized membrane protein YfcA